MPHSKDEGEAEEDDKFDFNEDVALKEDTARLDRVMSQPTVESLAPPPGKGAKATRRTSLLHLMLGGAAQKKPPPQSPTSPKNAKPTKQGSVDNIAAAASLDRRDTGLSHNSKGSHASHRSAAEIAKGMQQALSSVVDRRMSMMNRVRGAGGGHGSMDVDALLAEKRSRPFSAPIQQGRMGLRMAMKKNAQVDWEERWTIDDVPYYYNQKTEAISWEKPDELKTPEELEHEQGEWTWVPSSTIVWQGARVAKKLPNGDTICKTLAGGKQIIIPASGFLRDANTNGLEVKVPLWPLSKSSLYLLEDDLVALDDPNEALILHNLRTRYTENTIYTWVGASRSVLVSINPYKQLKGLYSRETIELQADKSPNRPPPAHVFGIAADALESLLWDSEDNSILISGESGAGKTEATKHVLKFLASVAGSKSHVEQRVLEANPILEAFGNAKTLRNKNSSRFGKWIEVNFDSKSRQISGASITSYLLERSRVTFQQKGERNFHIFYQLCTNESFKSQYALGDAESFRYLNQSDCIEIEGVDDAQELSIVIRSLAEMGFSPEEQEWVMRTTCAVLHLGNIDFDSVSDVKPPNGKTAADVKGLQGSAVSNKSRAGALGGRKNIQSVKPKKGGGANRRSSALAVRRSSAIPVRVDHQADTGRVHLTEAARLLGFSSSAELERVLCFRTVAVKDERNIIPLSPDDARNGADSFAMAIYTRLFEWLVGRINEALGGGRGHFVGVLDIFGFEIFEKNSFEQLCINYANEKLQSQFNNSMFNEEEGLYTFEEIDYIKTPFSDNTLVLKLIEGKPDGLLLQLDDEVKAPGGSDQRWASKMAKLHAQNERFHVDSKSKIESSLAFQVVHYAGTVDYSAHGFVLANTETMSEDMHMLANHSTDKLLAKLFPVDSDGRPMRFAAANAGGPVSRLPAKSTATRNKSVGNEKDSSRNRGKSSVSGAVAQGAAQTARAGAAGSRGQKTVGGQFREQLSELMEVLERTESRYVRCVKPNKTQSSDNFDSFLVLEQLRYSGVFEAVAIRRQGYPFRFTHRQFVYQYSVINKKGTKYRSRKDDYAGLAQEILDNSPQKQFKDVKIGKTMVLYRAREHKLLLLLRNLALERIVPWLQARMRSYIARKLLIKCREADKLFQSAIDDENDLDSLESAFTDVADTMGEILPRLFPRARPSKQREAEKLQADLKKMVELEEVLDALDNDPREPSEKYFDLRAALHKVDALSPPLVLTRRQERLVDNLRSVLESQAEMFAQSEKERLFAELEEKAEAALKALDRSQMRSLLEEYKREYDDRSSALRQELRKTLDLLARIDEDAMQAVKRVDRELMEKAVKEALALKYKSDDLRECTRLLGLPEYAFVKLEFEAAVGSRDERRRVHREIRLQELDLDKDWKQYTPFTEFRGLRQADEWAKSDRGFFAKLFGPKVSPGNFMRFQAKPIHSPLTSHCAHTDLKKRAVFVHKCLLAFAGDSQSADALDPDEAASSLLSAGLENKALRDEVYCQLVKQLAENPSTPSVRRVEELLGFCLSTFPPSAEMEPWVIVYLRQTFDDPKELKKYTSALHSSKYGGTQRSVKAIPDLRKEWGGRVNSRYSLQPGQVSGPSPPDQVSLQ